MYVFVCTVYKRIGVNLYTQYILCIYVLYVQNILVCAVERDDIRPPTLNSRNIQLSITSYTPPTRVFIYKVCRPS